MDDGKGKFRIINVPDENLLEEMRKLEKEYPDHRGWFKVGEVVEIRGSRFRIKSVRPTQIILKLLPKSV